VTFIMGILCQHKSSTTPPKRSDCSAQRLCFVGSKFVTENAYSSPTRKISILICLSVTKTMEFGRVERKPTSSKVVFWLSAKSFRSMSWCRLVCVSVAKDGCILSKRKLKLIGRITLATCFQIWWKTAIACCPPDDRVHLPAGWRASTHSVQCTELAAGQLSRFHHKGPVASKFARSKPNGLSRVGCNVGGSPQA